MKLRHLLLTGALGLSLTATEAFTQPPSGGGGGGRGNRGGGFGGFDPAQMFDRMAQGKGTIVIAEQDPRRQQFLNMIAQQLNITNGQITRDQYIEGMQKGAAMMGGMGRPGRGGPPLATPGGPTPAPGAPGAAPAGPTPDMTNNWAENMFRRLDTRGAGLLTYEEMPETLRAERDKWDTNKDGFIDLNEFKAFFQARMQQMQADRAAAGGPGSWPGGPTILPDNPIEDEEKKPAVYRAGKLPKDIPSWFKDLDTDGDGQIGLYEWKNSGRPLDEFFKMDRNGDGFLTVQEVMYHEAQVRGKSGSNGTDVAARDTSAGASMSGYGPPPLGVGGPGSYGAAPGMMPPWGGAPRGNGFPGGMQGARPDKGGRPSFSRGADNGSGNKDFRNNRGGNRDSGNGSDSKGNDKSSGGSKGYQRGY
jgi:Ca2+-binding EF-hand superfamily protein